MGAGVAFEERPVSVSARAARVRELEAEGARLVGVLNAASAGLVEVIAAAVSERLWECDGIRSAQHWVSLRFGMSSTRAARLVAAAEALMSLPLVREAFGSGEIGEDHVSEVARARVGGSHDEEVAGLAREATVSQLRRGLSFLPRVEPEPGAGADPDEPPVDRRRVGFGFGDLGGWHLQALGLGEAEGALVEKALTAARDDLFRASHGGDPVIGQAEAGEISWADALVRMAEAALDQLDPESRAGRPPSERYLVNIHFRADQPDPWASVHLGPVLPVSLRRELSCDAQVRAWVTTTAGEVNLGRRQRVVDPKLRAVVEHRDGGCVVQGCGSRRHLVIHHLVHWEDGGPTDTANLVALCRAHHRMVHDGRLVITGNPDLNSLVCADRHGQPLAPVPVVPPPGGDPAAGAAGLGLRSDRWSPRAGERADWKWVSWTQPDPMPPPTPKQPPSTDPPPRDAGPATPTETGPPCPPPKHRPTSGPRGENTDDDDDDLRRSA
ncbi:MAG TPA: DUF222 domain-containing protein [Acidimicrobiales bacterium]|nr:DUF222 domain-containing protein [Acidimicrobiales bacterium]